ncbi:hypothetical protein BC936DRAFT_147138, partial [Jimgerdemannia flammicorona]
RNDLGDCADAVGRFSIGDHCARSGRKRKRDDRAEDSGPAGERASGVPFHVMGAIVGNPEPHVDSALHLAWRRGVGARGPDAGAGTDRATACRAWGGHSGGGDVWRNWVNALAIPG